MSTPLNSHHAAGNEQFHNCKFFEACSSYQCALDEIPESDAETRSIVYANLSAAQLKAEKISEAIDSASRAVELNPRNVKGFYRRAQALACTLDWKGCVADFYEAAKVQPNVRFWRKQIELAQKQLRMQLYRAAMVSQESDTIVAQEEDTAPFEMPAFDAAYARALMGELLEHRLPHPRIVTEMLSRMKAANEKMDNIVALQQPGHIRVVGDTHGQYQDVLNMFRVFGEPSLENPYLFNGDYVDRGSMGVEILLCLFAWKLAEPRSVFMNRGNHETIVMNANYGFAKECASKYSEKMYDKFSDFFNYLPLGHVINGKCLVIHGGLMKDQNVTVEDINKMDRFGQPPETGPLNDILWSDPMEENGFAPSPRGVTSTFGPDVTERFLKNNNLELVIRSHQVQENGYCEMHDKKCITIFSAPNYIGQMGNKGAVILMNFNNDLSLKDYKYEQFDAQPIPDNYQPMKYANFNPFG